MVIVAPTIETERLVLRAHHRDDFAASAAMWSDLEVARFIGGSPSTPQESWFRILRYAGFWTLLGYGYWAITDSSTGEFLGEIGFADFQRGVTALKGFPEVGWVLAAAAWGRGIATEALLAVLSWADVNMAATDTRCIIDAPNVVSVGVAMKAGFQAIGVATLGTKEVTVFNRRRAWVAS